MSAPSDGAANDGTEKMDATGTAEGAKGATGATCGTCGTTCSNWAPLKSGTTCSSMVDVHLGAHPREKLRRENNRGARKKVVTEGTGVAYRWRGGNQRRRPGTRGRASRLWVRARTGGAVVGCAARGLQNEAAGAPVLERPLEGGCQI